MTTKHIALFGGSFDPPHQGHRVVCERLVADPRFDALWVIPAKAHAFGKKSASFEHRLAMLKILLNDLAPKVVVSAVEEEMTGEPIYTMGLIKHLQAKHPDHSWTWVMGSDTLAEKDLWKNFEQFKKEVDLLVLNRPGQCLSDDFPITILAGPFPEISSTQIRQQLGQGLSCSGLLDPGVLSYSQKNNLY